MERHKGEIYRVKKRGGRRKMKGGGAERGKEEGSEWEGVRATFSFCSNPLLLFYFCPYS